MYNGKYTKPPMKSHRRGSKRISTVMLSLLLLLTFAIGGTLAYLVTDTAPVENTFTPGSVSCQVEENADENNRVNFNGTEKKNINVRNTGSADSYIRVKLLSYRVNADGKTIGGEAPLILPPLGEGWVRYGDHYYYTKPVAPGQIPGQKGENDYTGTPLFGSGVIKLVDYTYTFYGASITAEEREQNPNAEPYGIKSGLAGGGKQVIEVIAEAIQADGTNSQGTPVVTTAWGMNVGANGVLTAPASKG